jgi:hypothetical protein
MSRAHRWRATPESRVRLAFGLTDAPGEPCLAGRFVGSPVCRRGLFESSPSWPESNGARHPPAPDHPPKGPLACYARRPRQGIGGGFLAARRSHFPLGHVMASSAGKRLRERQKLERAQAKAERKAARVASGAEQAEVSSHRSESELIEELGALHRAFEAGDVSSQEFEERRDRIRVQLEQFSR